MVTAKARRAEQVSGTTCEGIGEAAEGTRELEAIDDEVKQELSQAPDTER